jgi:chromodomain-helicase-DNA-binding protein 7
MREIIRNTEFNFTTILRDGDLAPSELPKFQVLLTNYEIFIKDFDILKNIAFQHIILDEAHRLKNKSSKITSTLNKLPCYRKTLLTGTPIQNNTKELWTLLNFIEPDIFNSEEEFQQKYGILENDDQVKAFRKELKPYLLRRIKEDVETTIPKLS